MIALTTPISVVADKLINDVACERFQHGLSSKRCTPAPKTFVLGVLRRDSLSPPERRPSDSVSRPVTSALIFGARSQKIGRIVENALLIRNPKSQQDAERDQRHQRADAQQNDQRKGSGHQAAEKLHQSVPTRLRMPSTSLMIRETSSPVLVGIVKI